MRNTYDIFKVFGVKKPLRLKGLPFNEGEYKITNYNVDYEPKTKTVLDKRYDGATGYGHYRYKSIPANKKSGLTRVFQLDDAEDMGFVSQTDKRQIQSTRYNLIKGTKGSTAN